MAVGQSGYSCAGVPSGEPAAGLLLDGDYDRPVNFDHLKIAEYISSSWYTYAEGDKVGRHPWQGETNPHYTGPTPPFRQLSDGQKYTWCKAPRYDGRPVQVGPNARLMLAVARNHGDTVTLVTRALQDLGLTKKQLNSTLGRTLCRCLETIQVSGRLVDWFEELREAIRQGNSKTFNPEQWEPGSWPKTAQGVGFAEAARGTLSHWVQIENGRVSRYECVVPSTWNSSGRDQDGRMGPYEEALAGGGKHPLVDAKRPLEVLRTIHSFDPCISCAVHLFDATGLPLKEVRAV